MRLLVNTTLFLTVLAFVATIIAVPVPAPQQEQTVNSQNNLQALQARKDRHKMGHINKDGETEVLGVFGKENNQSSADPQIDIIEESHVTIRFGIPKPTSEDLTGSGKENNNILRDNSGNPPAANFTPPVLYKNKNGSVNLAISPDTETVRLQHFVHNVGTMLLHKKQKKRKHAKMNELLKKHTSAKPLLDHSSLELNGPNLNSLEQHHNDSVVSKLNSQETRVPGESYSNSLEQHHNDSLVSKPKSQENRVPDESNSNSLEQHHNDSLVRKPKSQENRVHGESNSNSLEQHHNSLVSKTNSQENRVPGESKLNSLEQLQTRVTGTITKNNSNMEQHAEDAGESKSTDGILGRRLISKQGSHKGGLQHLKTNQFQQNFHSKEDQSNKKNLISSLERENSADKPQFHWPHVNPNAPYSPAEIEITTEVILPQLSSLENMKIKKLTPTSLMAASEHSVSSTIAPAKHKYYAEPPSGPNPLFFADTLGYNSIANPKKLPGVLDLAPEKTQSDLPPTKSEYSDESDELDVSTEYEKAMEKLKPHCPSGAHVLEGGKNFWKSFTKASGWKETLNVFKLTALETRNALKSCFDKMWGDVKGVFGRKKRDNKEDLDIKTNSTGGVIEDMKGAAEEFSKSFDDKVTQPVVNFFKDVSKSAEQTFGKRSIFSTIFGGDDNYKTQPLKSENEEDDESTLKRMLHLPEDDRHVRSTKSFPDEKGRDHQQNKKSHSLGKLPEQKRKWEGKGKKQKQSRSYKLFSSKNDTDISASYSYSAF